MRSVPDSIQTCCVALNDAWGRFAHVLTGPDGLAIADSEDALNWDAFIGRSVPFELTACPIRPMDGAADFSPLRKRGITIKNLADLWKIDALRDHLLFRRENAKAPAAASCELIAEHGGETGQLLCDSFHELPESSSHWSVRALLQNADCLSECGYSFRAWLERECNALGVEQFPPPDFRRMVVTTQPEGVGQRTIESALVSIMGRCFHRAGADVAAHILSDWQLGLWLGSRTQVFDLFPHAAHHQAFAIRCPEMPNDPAGFAAWWHAQPGCADLPPRIASACMACMEAGVAIPAQTQ